MALNLYLIERKDNSYDEVVSAVIAAENVRAVREIAATLGGDQGADAWLPKLATVTLIGTARAKKPNVIHTHFHAG